MSKRSSTTPTHSIEVPPSISTAAETIEIEKQQITSHSKEEESQKIQGITMATGSVQEVMAKGSNISYGSLPKPPVCNANQYGDCVKPINEDNRPCTVYNRCNRN
ncbi:hypothetical protein DITRI_Ditri13aG0153900 [Diplodiscus trichospermus]